MHLANMPIQKIANFLGLNVKALFDKGPSTMSITNRLRKYARKMTITYHAIRICPLYISASGKPELGSKEGTSNVSHGVNVASVPNAHFNL
jgi:hypothetical protein